MLQVSFSEKNLLSYINIATRYHGVDIATAKPDQLVGLTKKDDILGRVVDAEAHGNPKLAIKFYREVIEYANGQHDAKNNFLADEVNSEDSICEMRTEPLSDKEIAKFHSDFIMRLPTNLNPIELTESDIKIIARNNIALNKLVETIIRNNEDLAVNLFRATTELIQKQNGIL